MRMCRKFFLFFLSSFARAGQPARYFRQRQVLFSACIFVACFHAVHERGGGGGRVIYRPYIVYSFPVSSWLEGLPKVGMVP